MTTQTLPTLAGTRMTGDHGDGYNLCRRCGTDIGPDANLGKCTDCRTLNTHGLGPVRQRPYPHHPYTITVYDRRTGTYDGPTFDALHAHQLRHEVVNVTEDPFAYYYLMADLGYHAFPMVTVTHGTDLIASWEGHQPERIAALTTP